MTTSTRLKKRNEVMDGCRVVRLIGADPAADPDRTVLTYLVQRPDGHYRVIGECVPVTMSNPNQDDSNKED